MQRKVVVKAFKLLSTSKSHDFRDTENIDKVASQVRRYSESNLYHFESIMHVLRFVRAAPLPSLWRRYHLRE